MLAEGISASQELIVLLCGVRQNM